MYKLPRLVIHIGAGKTGSTAIQEALRSQGDALDARGVSYLGLMLEAAPMRRFAWQRPNGMRDLELLPPAQACSEMLSVLRDALHRGERSGRRILVVSNEAFLERGAVVHEVAKTLLDEGLDVSIVAYVRRHDAWAQSAYMQWELKHKTHSGPIRDFRTWVEHSGAGRSQFYPKLEPWRETFGRYLNLRNYDAVENSVADFLAVAGIDQEGLELGHANRSPGPDELVLRALFNDTQAKASWPARFEELFDIRRLNLRRGPSAWLQQLMPTRDDLTRIRLASAGDRARLDELLAENGQPPLATDVLEPARMAINPDNLIGVLFGMIVQQAVKIERLQELLDRPDTGQDG